MVLRREAALLDPVPAFAPVGAPAHRASPVLVTAPRLSLIVTTYERPDALQLVLRSVLLQRRPPDELVVADDGSGEATRRIVQRFVGQAPFPVRHCWREHSGFRLAEMRNRAIAMATGDYVVVVDGDLVLHPSFLADHERAARPATMIQGGRVLLSEPLTRGALASGRTRFAAWLPGLRNRKNAVRSRLLSWLASYHSRNVYRVRGANLAFWRQDVLRVNGFDEGFVGWGREDSEFVARMQNAGVRRLNLKFAAVAFHLWHPEASRDHLRDNEELLRTTLATRAQRCVRGLDRHLSAA
jgi:glycosyltransferase involved in cell wall biosynthesis